jgi:hypothetical protein
VTAFVVWNAHTEDVMGVSMVVERAAAWIRRVVESREFAADAIELRAFKLDHYIEGVAAQGRYEIIDWRHV